jgi:acetylglutamate kinase
MARTRSRKPRKAAPAEHAPQERTLAAAAKAGVLTEALPYIQRWAGKTVVVKIGGEALTDPDSLDSFVTDVVLLKFVGINPVVVHGGGPQISEAMREVGLHPAFVGGKRVSDAETMQVVKRVLLEENRRLAAAMVARGAHAAGISGQDAAVLLARRVSGPNGEDIGFVGEVERVNPSLIFRLIRKDHIPAVAPLGAGPDGAYNINADLAAGALAASLGAQKIVFLTNVPGLYSDFGDAGSLISEITTGDLERLLGEGTLSEGMIPKIEAVVAAMRAGVPQAHILDGRVPHALLLEIFTDEGSGTMVLPDPPPPPEDEAVE